MADPAARQSSKATNGTRPSRPGRKRRGGSRSVAGGWQPPRLSGYNTYSRFVGLMKLALPAVAVGLGLLILAWPQIFPEDDAGGLSFNPMDRDQAQSLSMVEAHFQGRDERDRPYHILADLAEQREAESDEVDLTRPRANLRLEDGNLMELRSNTGRYWRDSRHLVLNGAVNLNHHRGFDLDTSQAEIDLEANRAWGVRPVAGRGPSGEIEAEGFEIQNGGEVIIFTGRSHLTLRSEGGGEAPSAEETGESAAASGGGGS